jgi:hypothetical protein
MVVSHHFMSPDEVATERGRARLAACVVRVPVDGEMVPMCRMNAAGVRDALYDRARHPDRTGSPLLPVVA